MSKEGAKTLARRARETHAYAIVRQAFVAEAPGDFARQHGADSAIDVANRHLDGYFFAALERWRSELDQPVVQRTREAVILTLTMHARDRGWHRRLIENL